MTGIGSDNIPVDLFRVLFEKSPGSLLLKTDEPRFTIVAMSDTYLKTTLLPREEIIGKGFFEIYGAEIDERDDTAARRIFSHVIRTGDKVDIPVYRYDIFEPGADFKTPHYWSFSTIPIMDDRQQITYI